MPEGAEATYLFLLSPAYESLHITVGWVSYLLREKYEHPHFFVLQFSFNSRQHKCQFGWVSLKMIREGLIWVCKMNGLVFMLGSVVRLDWKSNVSLAVSLLVRTTSSRTGALDSPFKFFWVKGTLWVQGWVERTIWTGASVSAVVWSETGTHTFGTWDFDFFPSIMKNNTQQHWGL